MADHVRAGDGIIDGDEFRVTKAAEIDLKRLDKDRDGKITKEEWIERYGSLEGFNKYDLDGVFSGAVFLLLLCLPVCSGTAEDFLPHAQC